MATRTARTTPSTVRARCQSRRERGDPGEEQRQRPQPHRAGSDEAERDVGARRSGRRRRCTRAGDNEDRRGNDRRYDVGADHEQRAARQGEREDRVEVATLLRGDDCVGDDVDREVADRQRHDQAEHLGVHVALDGVHVRDAERLLQAGRVHLCDLRDGALDRRVDRRHEGTEHTERAAPGQHRTAPVKQPAATHRTQRPLAGPGDDARRAAWRRSRRFERADTHVAPFRR